MKDQNKNQKAPETKLTDEQLGEVNAGWAEDIAMRTIRQASGKCSANANTTSAISTGLAKTELQKI